MSKDISDVIKELSKLTRSIDSIENTMIKELLDLKKYSKIWIKEYQRYQ